MTFLTYTLSSVTAAATAVAPSVRMNTRVAARKTANLRALAGRYVH